MRLVITAGHNPKHGTGYSRPLGGSALTEGRSLKGFVLGEHHLYPYANKDIGSEDYILFDPADVPVNATTDVAALPEYIQERLAVLQLLRDEEWLYLAGVGCVASDGGYIIEGGE